MLWRKMHTKIRKPDPSLKKHRQPSQGGHGAKGDLKLLLLVCLFVSFMPRVAFCISSPDWLQPYGGASKGKFHLGISLPGQRDKTSPLRAANNQTLNVRDHLTPDLENSIRSRHGVILEDTTPPDHDGVVTYKVRREEPRNIPHTTREHDPFRRIIEKTPLPTEIRAEASISDEDMFFEALDCSTPKNIVDTVTTLQDTCDHPIYDDDMIFAQNKSYVILQKRTTEKIDGYSCSMTITRRVIYCGVYDHTTESLKDAKYDEPVEISPETCRKWVETGSYRTPTKVDVPIKLNSVTVTSYFKAGKSYIADWGEIKCAGASFNVNGVTVPRAVVWEQAKISILKESVISAGGVLRAVYDNKLLSHCTQSQGSCSSMDTTYVWKPPHPEECGADFVTEVSGSVIENKDQTVFMSTNGQMIRLIMRNDVTLCDDPAISTHVPNIYLIDVKHINKHRVGRAKWGTIDPSAVDLPTWIVNRDEFIYHHSMTQIYDEFAAIVQQTCAARHASKVLSLRGEQSPSPVPRYKGNSTFTMQAGDVSYSFRCSPTLTVGRRTEQCYQELPIHRLRIDHDGTPLGVGEPAFLEPITHRIIKEASVIPCSMEFQQKWKNYKGKWVTNRPTYTLVNDPILETETSTTATIGTYDETLDFKNGGLYTTKQVAGYLDALEYGNHREAVTSRMAYQVESGTLKDGESLRQGQIFEPVVTIPWFHNYLEDLFGYYDAWKDVCLTILVLWITFKILTELGRIFLNLKAWCTGPLTGMPRKWWYPGVAVFPGLSVEKRLRIAEKAIAILHLQLHRIQRNAMIEMARGQVHHPNQPVIEEEQAQLPPPPAIYPI